MIVVLLVQYSEYYAMSGLVVVVAGARLEVYSVVMVTAQVKVTRETEPAASNHQQVGIVT